MKLLDTTFLIDYEQGSDDVEDYLTAHESDEFATSTICLKELAVGKHLAGSPTLADVTSNYGWLRIVPFTAEQAHVAGDLEARLRDDSTINRAKIRSVTGDVLVAAAAKANDATVVTRNVDDFAEFDGVEVEAY